MNKLRGAGWLLLLVNCLVLGSAPGSTGVERSEEPQLQAAAFETPTTIRAAGRGGPWINVTDGRPVPTRFSAGSRAAERIENGTARPLALASADFDEDGVPDVVCSYATIEGGFITFHRGNADAIYPNAPQAKARRAAGKFTDAPFLPDARSFDIRETPDLIAAGDFDADGHWDLVSAERGGETLLLHLGDGKGGFGAAVEIDLPGRVTAMTSGEINRRDGLTDLVVGVEGENGSHALVFEGPNGAFRSTPERIPLAAPASELSINRFDAAIEGSLTIAAGRELTIVHGRDRRLTHREDRRAMVEPPAVRRMSLSFTIAAMALGDFNADRQIDVALLDDSGELHVAPARNLHSLQEGAGRSVEQASPGIGPLPAVTPEDAPEVALQTARISSRPGDDLILTHWSGRRLHLRMPPNEGGGHATIAEGHDRPSWVPFDLQGEPVAVLPMRLNGDALSDLVVLSTGGEALSTIGTEALMVFTVTNTNQTGAGSLYQAIIDANSNPGADSITFSIPGAGPHTIHPPPPFFVILDPVTIDASTEPDIVEIDGSMGAESGFLVDAGDTTIRGFVINRFPSSGVRLEGSSNNFIEGNFIGIDTTGTVAAPNGFTGIAVSSPDTTIGGTLATARNVISGNMWSGIWVNSVPNFVIQGNYIGTNASGTAAIANQGNGGIYLLATAAASIGGTTAGAGNLISGNLSAGIRIDNASPGTVVQGNLIGTTANGQAAIGNIIDGIEIESPSNTIGGTTPAARNIISGNDPQGIRAGLSAGPAVLNNLIQGNFIGTNIDGTLAVGNLGDGVVIRGPNNVIGGNTASARNIISGNAGRGVSLQGINGIGNDVLSNYIGTRASGAGTLGNGSSGVSVTSDDNRIGGASTATANVISGNHEGVDVGGTGNLVEVNFIGTDHTGTFDLGNLRSGIWIRDASGPLIGIKTGQANLISGNDLDGIRIDGTSTGVAVQGNIIGLNAAGTSPLSNSRFGIAILSNGNVIGGATSSEGNTISGNGRNGIFLDASAMLNQIQNNKIGTSPDGSVAHSNLGDGIHITRFASQNVIGGPSATLGNVIAHSVGAGVRVVNGNSNSIRSNSIFGNLELGIDLLPNGVTPNDPGDADTGANKLQNFPVLSSVTTTGGLINFDLTLNSSASAFFDIDLYHSPTCDSSGHGEGQTFLGSGLLITDATGNGGFSSGLPVSVPAGEFLTITATDIDGNTSEFSACAAAVGVPPMGTSGVVWDLSDVPRIMWDESPGADFYNVYVGGPANLAHLIDSDPDSCQQTVVQGATFLDIPITQNPPLGQLVWWIVRPQNQYGQGNPLKASSGPREHDSTGFCGLSCAHDKGVEGAALESACDPCVSIVCADDPFCCNDTWDSLCVQNVRTVCGSLTTGESQGQCQHSACTTGAALQPNCDDPPVSPSCVEQICANDSFCCTNQWDNLCVEQVTTVCGQSCL